MNEETYQIIATKQLTSLRQALQKRDYASALFCLDQLEKLAVLDQEKRSIYCLQS